MSNGKQLWKGEQLGRLSWLCHWALQPTLRRSSQPLKVVAKNNSMMNAVAMLKPFL